ncbi:hypothetical protein TRIUR3_16589 [Triticum urartu]|uniref:Uncharacterized protein n=1 Tax=Triticum urartu TaxID=4572 RepID=M7Z3H8_TRIUA|nr:hypothetical protein TRIUR3_16589 [Triticum urartu]
MSRWGSGLLPALLLAAMLLCAWPLVVVGEDAPQAYAYPAPRPFIEGTQHVSFTLFLFKFWFSIHVQAIQGAEDLALDHASLRILVLFLRVLVRDLVRLARLEQFVQFRTTGRIVGPARSS